MTTDAEETTEEIIINETQDNPTSEGEVATTDAKPDGDLVVEGTKSEEAKPEAQSDGKDADAVSTEVEWDQDKPIVKSETTEPSADLAGLQSQLDAANQEISGLRNTIAAMETNPIMEPWLNYQKANGDASTFQGFVSQFSKTQQFSDSEPDVKMLAFFKMEAAQSGISAEDIEDAAIEELNEWENLTSIKKSAMLKKATEALSSGNDLGVAEVDKKIKAEADRVATEAQSWAKSQYENFNDYFNKVLAKGTYNDRPVDEKWKQKMMKQVFDNPILSNPSVVPYNPKGDIYIPDAVEILDGILNRTELKDVRKRTKGENIASSIETNAAAAQNQKIAQTASKKNTTLDQIDAELEQWQRDNRKRGGIPEPVTKNN